MEPHSRESPSAPPVVRLYEEWKRIHDSYSSSDIGQRNALIERFLEGFNQFDDDERRQLDRLNRCENIASALSRQLLLLIYEICDPTVRRYGWADPTVTLATASTGPSRTETSDEQTSESDESGVICPASGSSTDAGVGRNTTATTDLLVVADSSESRCERLKDFFLNGIGGRLVQTLARIGAKDISNGREITAVLVRILPTTRWSTESGDDGTTSTDLQATPQYGEYVRSVLTMRSYHGDWREWIKRSFCESSVAFQGLRELSSALAPSSSPYHSRQLSSSFWGRSYQTTLTQDQFTLTVLMLLESLIAHENIHTIDENSVTVSCLRMAIEQLKQNRQLEESAANRAVLRHRLLGLVMLCLNNMFFLETLDSQDANLRLVAADMMELLKRELEEKPSTPEHGAVSCDFLYNLIYTIVSAVNQSFLHYCEHLVSEQLFLSIFKLLESNLEIVKRTYRVLQHGATPVLPQCSSLINILLKMLQNFIFALTPVRINGRKARKCRFRLHHSRQDSRAAYVCALEHLLLNLFPLVRHSDQRALVNFFKVYQLCCCNTNAHTLELLLKLSNDELIPKVRLSFTARAVVGAIFDRSQCETCESDRAANTFYEQFTRTHRDVFWEFGRTENRAHCMPTYLRYLQDIVRVVPYRLKAFIVEELVLELLRKQCQRSEVQQQAAHSQDDGWKDVVNGCLVIVCRAVTDDHTTMELFYRAEHMELLRALVGRVEVAHSMHSILTLGVRGMDRINGPIQQQLIELLLNALDDRDRYLAGLFETISSSNGSAELQLKTIESSGWSDCKLREEPLDMVLQLHLEHWKTVRQLLRDSDCFRRTFWCRYEGCKGVERFLDISYNLATVCLYRPREQMEEQEKAVRDPEPALMPAFMIGHSVTTVWQPERQSVLNIFHFTDRLIDETLSESEASFYYSAHEDEPIVCPARIEHEDDDYSFLRELRCVPRDHWPSEFAPNRVGVGKLEKKWSLSELFNIRRMMADLMDGYFAGGKRTRPSAGSENLPAAARTLLDPGSTVVRKKLTNLFETIVASMQLLSSGDVAGIESIESIKSEQGTNTMQLALFELKRLLLSSAINNWSCPGSANDVMNVLQALLKVAEMRKDSSSPGQSYRDSAERDSFSEREKSYEEDEELLLVSTFASPYRFPDTIATAVVDDVSSTDESYTTARDDGYEGDVEIETYQPPPQSRLVQLQGRDEQRTGLRDPVGKQLPRRSINAQICTLVTEILVELSVRCTANPDHWCSVLAQMVVKLNMIRHCLGGSLYLIQGFRTVLQTNDSRLKELQASIMDLIVDLDNPDVLVRFVQLLVPKDPPVESILTKLTKLFEAGTGLECYQSVQFPAQHPEATFWSSSDVLLAKKITFLREHHLHYGIRSGFTDSALMVPLNFANFYPWHGNGFTVSTWFRAVQLMDHQRAPDYTHLLSVGSEKQLISLYFTSQRQLIVRYSKPDRALSSSATDRYFAAARASSSCCDDCAKEMLHLWTYKHLLRTISDVSSLIFQLDTPGAQCVYCFKPLPLGMSAKAHQSTTVKGTRPEEESFVGVADLNLCRQLAVGQDWCAPEGSWSMLTAAVQQTDETVSITLTLDGVQQLAQLTLPNGCRIHIDTDLAVLGIGHRAVAPNECSTGYALGGVHLFGRCITDGAALATLYAIGPNVNSFGAVATGCTLPNYGTLNLAKLTVSDLRPAASARLLERSHLGCWVAHKPDCFVARNQSIGLMTFVGQKMCPVENASLQRALLIAGGVSVMLVCFARIVELSDSPNLQSAALKLLLRIAHSNHEFYNEFVQCNHLELIDIVLKSARCHKDLALLTTLFELGFDQPIIARRQADQYRVLTGSTARVRYPAIITFLLENFHIWIDRSEEVLDLLFDTLATATRDKHPAMMYNCARLQDAALVPALIDFCRVNFVIPARTVKISRKAADLLVSLISILSPTPPRVPLLNEIMELLLLMHKPTDSYVTHDRQKFYFNISPGSYSGGTGAGKRVNDKVTGGSAGSSSSSTNAGGVVGTPKMQLRDRRLRPSSQLRKILPLTIAAGSSNSSSSNTSGVNVSSLESATTSFIIETSTTSNNTSVVVSDDSSVKAIPEPAISTPKSAGSASSLDAGLAGLATEELCYERLNKALADSNIRRKSAHGLAEKGGGKRKQLRRLNSSPNVRVALLMGARDGGRQQSGSPRRSATNSPKGACPRNELHRSRSSGNQQQQHQQAPSPPMVPPARYKFFEQNYFATGNDFLQEAFLRLMCDLLLILPDADARKFLSGDNRMLEVLLVLANNGNIRIRTMLLNLVAVIDDRMADGVISNVRGSGSGGNGSTGSTGGGAGSNTLLQYSEEQSKVFWYHLANQIGAHSVNEELLASCLRWITKAHNPLQVLFKHIDESPPVEEDRSSTAPAEPIEVIRENGLNVLIAILIQAHSDPRLFRCVLQVLENIVCSTERPRPGGQYCVDNGLVWALVKTAVKMHEKNDGQSQTQESRASLLSFLTSFSHFMLLNNVANPFWDLLNGLTVVGKHKHERVTRAVRIIHATLLRSVLQIFIFRPKQSIIGNKNTSFTVELTGCDLSKAEVKARFNRLHDKAVQFVTNSDPDGEISDAETALVRHLMNRTLNGNPRGGNIILWCLLPKRPLSLKIYTIKQLGCYLEGGGNHLSAICDIKMLKVFVQSILLLNQKHIPLDELRLVNTFYQSIDGAPMAQGSSWNLTQTLKDFEYLRAIALNDQEQTILKSIARQEKLIYSCTVAAMQITRNSVEKQNRLRKELIIQLRKDNDYRYYDQWRRLVGRMTHEDAPWYDASTYPSCWERDNTYGPDMTLRRMQRCQLSINPRFLLKEARPEEGTGGERKGLLSYLFARDYRHEYSVEEQVLYTFTVLKISPVQELPCECILTCTEMVLKPYDGELEIYDLHDIAKMWTKRYQQQESAVEVLLKSGQSLFIVFERDASERDTFEHVFQDHFVRCGRQELDHHTQQWREGTLSNWEYLMLLNQVSGRTYHDLMQYPVFPWVLATYDTRTLDLLSERTFRNLEKPIAVQHRELEKHYINNYNNLRQADSGGDPSGDRRKIQPYHYSSLYSNSGTVLHFLVRVFPFTKLFLHYQDDSFDIPDRTFHSLQTTWNLASRDSPTDVKELIPEFFSFPEFLENREGLDFGVRQSGDPVNHVELPPWCHNSARLFVLIHRQALEASVVRRQLSHWIDLIFGYKQMGQSAIEAINVFHPATHCDFSVADIDDPVMKLALETMVKTYGQMPRRLFEIAHPPPGMNTLGASPPKVLDSVIGLRWGLYCGSPVLANPRLADAWAMLPSLREKGAGKLDVVISAALIALDGDRVFVMPERMNVFCVVEAGTTKKQHYTISWGERDDRLRIRPLQQDTDGSERPRELYYGSNTSASDPITACGTDPNCTSIFLGHRSGRIAVFQPRTRRRRLSFFNQNMQPPVTMVRTRSSSFRRWIDRKSANLRRRLELDGDADLQQQQQHYQQQLQLQEDEQMDWNYPILLLKHRAPISAIRLSMEFRIVVSVSIDGCAVIWDANSLAYVREIPKPVNVLHSRISEVAISPTLGDIVTVHSQQPIAAATSSNTGLRSFGTQESWSSTTLVEEDDSFEVTENYNLDYVNITMATHRDQLRLYTINAQYVEHVFVESPIRAVTYSSIKEGSGVNCIVVALESGIVRFYSSWNLALVREINVEPHDIRCALFSKYQHLLLLTSQNTVQTWTAEGLPGPMPTIQEPYQNVR
ncbi:lysosomal-trafficking regulator-like [Anopheles albimanus]|uniref:lysosomal-trafficking regulator-like n=1 Tax=Anopheles albimanus TaxID=7167 RepID=UPI00163EB2CA|nr:lysosomal-trafficking regulator-like [Anopheles albimanus]